MEEDGIQHETYEKCVIINEIDFKTLEEPVIDEICRIIHRNICDHMQKITDELKRNTQIERM